MNYSVETRSPHLYFPHLPRPDIAFQQRINAILPLLQQTMNQLAHSGHQSDPGKSRSPKYSELLTVLIITSLLLAGCKSPPTTAADTPPCNLTNISSKSLVKVANPDGTSSDAYLFSGTCGNSDSNIYFQRVTYDEDGIEQLGSIQVVSNSALNEKSPTMHPAGEWIVFVEYEGNTSRFVGVNVNTGERVALTDFDTGAKYGGFFLNSHSLTRTLMYLCDANSSSTNPNPKGEYTCSVKLSKLPVDAHLIKTPTPSSQNIRPKGSHLSRKSPILARRMI